MMLFVFAGALALLPAARLPTTTLASAFVVDSTIDAVEAAPGDGVCATAAGECTLRAAIQETNALPGADKVTLPIGTTPCPSAGH